MIKRIQYAICWLAYVIWRALPLGRCYETGFVGHYGQFHLWLLGYAGAYAYSDDFEDFRANVNFRPEPRP